MWVQQRAGEAVRAKVAGPRAVARAQRIWGTPGPRWFTPDDPIWRVHDDASMFCGGVAALLLQSLHPGAMAGVADHSDYKGDPWGRLQRTSEYLSVTTFGTVPHAEQMIAGVRRIHARVQGDDHRGRPYRAEDPHLLAWVHAAQTTAFLTAHDWYGRHPLDDAEADLYVRQTGSVAERLGVLDPPQSRDELAWLVERYRPELEATPASAEAAEYLARHAPLPAPVRPAYGLIITGGVALLPGWARELLGTIGRRGSRPGARPIGVAVTQTIRWALAAVPKPEVPAEISADSPTADRTP